MHPHLAHWLIGLARTLGLAGIFILTLLDSSFLIAVPGLNDLALLSFVIAKNDWMWAITAAALATIGSVLGSQVTYKVGQRGGSALLRSRFTRHWQQRVMAWTKRYGALPVGLAAVMPPPCPYAPFVITAGMLSIPKARFSISVALGRGARYAIDATLAMLLGRHLLRYWQLDYWAAIKIFAWVAADAAALWLLYHFFLRRRAAIILPFIGEEEAAEEVKIVEIEKSGTNGHTLN